MLHGLTPPPKFTRFCSQDLDGVLRPMNRLQNLFLNWYRNSDYGTKTPLLHY
jgi:hypothetical protein